MFKSLGPNKLEALSDDKVGIVIDSKIHGRKIAIIDKQDVAKVSGHRWCVEKRRYTFYAREKGGAGYLHRFLLGIVDSVTEVDHKNGNGLDCRRRNICRASSSQNCWNSQRRKDNTSGIKGVSKHGAKWHAYINVYGKRRHLGLFRTLEAASKARAKAVKELHGKFARTG